MMKLRIGAVLLAVTCCLPVASSAQNWNYALGFNSGVSRLEGDLRGASLSPIITGHFRVLPVPYFALNGEIGYASLNSDRADDFKTTIIPLELSAIFNFLPARTVNPYVFVGGGGVIWKAKNNAGTLEDNFDSFLKTGGGLEFRLSRMLSFNLGATYRFSFTDAFDQLRQGDENDQVLDVHAGFTYYLGNRTHDRDHDFIPDELDLMPDIAEDKDGYLDHDGIPEKNVTPERLAASGIDAPIRSMTNSNAPIVIHYLIREAESGRGLPVKTHVYSDVGLKVVAALYRPVGTSNWNVVRLDPGENSLYEGEIPAYALTEEGLEYCVVAVDETLGGIGYAGLPSQPIHVTVLPSGKPWRFIGGAVGAAAVGTASYLVLRKQK